MDSNLKPDAFSSYNAVVEDGPNIVVNREEEEEGVSTIVADDGNDAKLIPRGSLVSGVFNLAGSSLGAGILGLPYAFYLSGIIVSTLYLIVIFALTVFSLRLMALTAEKTGCKSYEGLALRLFGKGGDSFAAVIMIIKCFGACVAYVICVGDVWSAFLRKEYVGEYYSSRGFISFLTAVAFVCLMLPLSLPKHINSLRYVSLVGVSFILLFVLGVIVHSCAAIAQPDFDNGGLVYFQSGENALRGMGLFMFAYLCQSNMFEVWNEMRPAPTVRRMEVEGFIGMLICTVLYWFSGLFGYLEFGENIRPSLLSMYTPTKNIFFAFAYCGIVVKLCVAFALHVLPCRDAIYHLIEWNLETLLRNKNIAFCASLSLLSLLLGLLIPNISVVFGLLGSFAGGFVGFIFPALFFMYCGGFTVEAVGYQDFYGAYALLISGVIVVCFGTTVTIYNYF